MDIIQNVAVNILHNFRNHPFKVKMNLEAMKHQEKLDMDNICIILEEEKPNQREQIKIRADLLNKYFPKDYTPKQKRKLIEQLVKE